MNSFGSEPLDAVVSVWLRWCLLCRSRCCNIHQNNRFRSAIWSIQIGPFNRWFWFNSLTSPPIKTLTNSQRWCWLPSTRQTWHLEIQRTIRKRHLRVIICHKSCISDLNMIFVIFLWSLFLFHQKSSKKTVELDTRMTRILILRFKIKKILKCLFNNLKPKARFCHFSY